MNPIASQEAEEQAVGCCLLDPQHIGRLNLEWFRDLRLRDVAQIMRDMLDANEPVNTATVTQKIKSVGRTFAIGFDLGEVEDKVQSPASFPHWAKILDEKLALRAMHELCSDFADRAQQSDADAGELVEEFETKALTIRPPTETHDVDVKATLQEVVDEFEWCFQHKGEMRGLPTGFSGIDGLLRGLMPGQVFVIAARPGVGKSAIAMNIADNVACKDKKHVGVFSLEMSPKELLARMLCASAEISSQAALDGDLRERDFAPLANGFMRLKSSPIHIHKSSGITIGQIRAQARRWKQQHNVSLIIIDYLQLVRSGSGNAKENGNERVTQVSQGIKAMAMELEIPVIALAQLSRDVEKGERQPRLSDLRDSGSIEQDADIVGLMHREKSDDEVDDVLFIIAKNRSGRTDATNLCFFRSITKFKQGGKSA